MSYDKEVKTGNQYGFVGVFEMDRDTAKYSKFSLVKTGIRIKPVKSKWVRETHDKRDEFADLNSAILGTRVKANTLAGTGLG